MKTPFVCVSRQSLYENPYWCYQKDEYRIPSGECRDYHFAQTRGSVLIIPRTADHHFVLVRQYRYIQQRWGLEFPGGGKKEHESALESAQQELQEEVGLEAQHWVSLGEFAPCVGLLDEMCEVFVATDLRETARTPEDSELLETIVLTEADIEQAIREGELWSGMSLVVWLKYKLFCATEES